jgi:hypothetical protein
MLDCENTAADAKIKTAPHDRVIAHDLMLNGGSFASGFLSIRRIAAQLHLKS